MGSETQDAVTLRPDPVPGRFVRPNFIISNGSATNVDVYRIQAETFAEEFVRSVPAGATVVEHTAEAEAWLAKAGDRCVARYTYCPSVPLWQLHLERPGVECTFAIENRRAEPVDVYRFSGVAEEASKVMSVGPGETRLQISLEAERWVAKVGDLPVAVYEATPRVPYWQVTDALTDFVPSLPTGTNSHLNESPRTADIYQKATGAVKAIMVFVEFPDCAGTKPTRAVSARITGDALHWYNKESYGRLSFSVTPHGEWRMMPRAATLYDRIGSDGNAHRDYISTALRLFSPDEINFGDFNIAYVVAAETPENVLPNSPTLSAGIEVRTNNGTVRHAVTFGRDCYTRTFNVLLHETGHLMGLPDLYTFGRNYPDLIRPAGAWDIMCHLDGGKHYLGWHKFKLGWLDESQFLYLRSGEVSVKLHAFDSAYGIKGIVVPAETDSKVYVVEVAQALSDEPELCCKGILVYTVDAAVATGDNPVNLVSGPETAPEPDETERYGARYYACLAVGKKQVFNLERGAEIEVANEREEGPHFHVRVRRSRR